jgi:hypothetical protein
MAEMQSYQMLVSMAGMKDHKLPELSIWKLTNNEGIEFSI